MSEHPHMPPVLVTGARKLSPGKIVVVIRGVEHVLPWEEAEELRDSISSAMAGPEPQIVCEVIH